MGRLLYLKQLIPFIAIGLIFLVIKISGNQFRLSDTNIYFYTGLKILEGKVLYKDIFFTNFPLLPYISAFYAFVLQKNLYLFYLTSTLETLTTASLLYYLSYTSTKDRNQAASTAALYLFSFIVLTTTDHQTGVSGASLLSIIAYFFLTRKKHFLSGVFIACTLLMKAYFLPIALAFFVTLLLQKKLKPLLYFCSGGVLAGLLFLLPSLILARRELFADVISYSLRRSQGIEKKAIIQFFITHDPFLFILFITAFFTDKKNYFFSLLALFSMLFITFYQDIYYLYLNFAIPFLVLLFPRFIILLEEKLKIPKVITYLSLFVIFSSNTLLYFSYYWDLQTTNTNTLVTEIQKTHASVLYGTNDIAPLLAFLTDRQLLGGIIDTNDNIYKKGLLDKTTMTKKAVEQKALLLTRGAEYPEYNVHEEIMAEIFDKKLVQKSCRLIASVPAKTESAINRINVFACGQ